MNRVERSSDVFDEWLRRVNADINSAVASALDSEAVLDQVKRDGVAERHGLKSMSIDELIRQVIEPQRPAELARADFDKVDESVTWDGLGSRRLTRMVADRATPGHLDVLAGEWRRPIVLAELVWELKTLRKGRGLCVRQISDRVGPALRKACDVADGDGPVEIRRKVAERLESLANGLPADLRVAIVAAFALDRDARLPFYQDRVRWAAARLQRDDRTARRRIDEGIERIAELAASSAGGRSDDVLPSDGSAASWHTNELRISLVLDQSAPEAFEIRRVVADRDRLSELDLALTLTAGPDRDQPVGVDGPSVDALYGGRLIKPVKESTDRFGFVLELPRELRRDETHEFALRYRVQNGQMQPHYVCVPKHRCDMFDLRVRFDLEKMPEHIWRLVDAFQRDVDDPAPSGEILPPDAAGEVHTMFRQLTPGKAYGIRWISASDDD